MADTNPADVQEPTKPAKAPTRVRLATEDHLTRFVVPAFAGGDDLVIDFDGVSLPAKDAEHVTDLAADLRVRLVSSPEKD
jgi:hypothetical protein